MSEEYTSLKDLNFDYSHNPNEDFLLAKKLKEKGFNDTAVVNIMNCFLSVCRHCYNGEHDCQCWNDD